MLTARSAFAALVLTSTVATGCDMLDSDRIGSDGGMVISADGRMALEVPPGALDDEVDISIEIVEGPEGSASDLYVVEPMGLTVNRPVVLTYDYDEQTLDGSEPEAMTIVAHRELGWAYLGDQEVDDEDQTLSASLMALSAVVVVIEGE